METAGKSSYIARSLFTALIITFALLQPLIDAFGQEKQIVNTITGPDGQRHTLTEGHATFISHGDSIVDKFVTPPEGDSRIIVQFESPPLSSLRASGRIPFPGEQEELRTQIHAEQDLFLFALARIERMLDIDSYEPYTRDGRLHFVYEQVFNGVSLTAKQAVTAEIQSLPYVRKVHADEAVHALIDESIGVIGADDIWSDYDVTGEGIVVGILDTGIDYMHPDLGGGIGQEYKVIGGYDFVNGNNDPMDDHGHGTHVAGIVAANGQLQGVAPDARLVGYKVLDHEGYGYASWIIAGIEQSVIDGVDILNVSLGGPGSPDDPMSQAIDNASAAGVVCVVAAGNSGPGYYTLGSPGVAKNALTVGATHLNDDIASFSSKGPVNQTHDIKPDVMAPGVQINAPVLNAGYQQMNGTSMAAPHVAGAAALLLAEYPDLTPKEIKSIFSQSAKDMGLNVWSQGAGRIDLQAAFQLPGVIVSPNKISFGPAEPQDDYWITSKTLNIRNNADTNQWITLSLDEGFPDGVDVIISPTQFTLQPDESLQVEITLTVDNQAVAFSEDEAAGYYANLSLDAETYSTNVPLTFIKSPILRIQLEEEPAFIKIFGENKNHYGSQSQELIQHLPAGIYHIFIQYKDWATTLIFEHVTIDGYYEMILTKEDAKNHVTIIAPDINDNPVETKRAFDKFELPHDWFLSMDFLELAKDRYFTDYDNTTWYWAGFDFSESARTMHVVGGILNECLSDTILSYASEELALIQLDYTNASDAYDLFSFGTLAVRNWQLPYWDSFSPPLTHPFKQDIYFSPTFKPGPDDFGFYIESYAHTGHLINPFYRDPLYKTARIFFDDGGHPLISTYDYYIIGQNPSPNIISLKGNNIRMHLGPPLWNGKFYHRTNNQLLMTNLMSLFQLQMKGTFKADQLQYALYQNETLAAGGDFFEEYPFFGAWYALVDFEPGEYVLEIDYDHYVIQGVDGTATARMGFNTSTGEGFIPRLSAFNISYEDAYYTDMVGIGEGAVLDFVVEIAETFQEESQITLEYRAGSDAGWHDWDISGENGNYQVPIPDTLPGGYISLRLTAVDGSGSFLEYTVAPAFLLAEGGPALAQINNGVLNIYQNSAVIHSEVTEDGGSAVTDRGVVWCTSEYPDLNNHLGVTSDGKGLGRFISHVSGMESNTTYYARAYATNSLGVAYSEPFMLDQIPDCLPPKALYAESVTQTSAMIGWTEAGEAQLWDIVYGYEGFDPDTEGYMVSAADIPYQLEDLQHSAVYEFYVRSHCDDVSSAWSEPASFTTECDTPVFVFQTPDEGETINITTDSTIPYSYYFFGCNWVVARLFIADDSQEHYVKNFPVSASGFYEDVFEAFETLPGGTYRLRLRYTYDEQEHMLESNEFEIINDNTQVMLTRPRAGRYAVSGYPLAIRWNALNTPFVNIDYSLDLGQSWSTAAHNVASPDGYGINGQNAFNWLIPAHIEGVHPESRIRIQSTDDPGISSISAPFIISENLPVKIMAPTAESLIEINEDMEIIIEVLNPSTIDVYLGNQAGFVDHIASLDAGTTVVSTLEELRKKPDDGTVYHYTGEAVIVAMDDYRNRMFLQDETAAIMIDDYPGVITTNYDLYDVITNVAGQISIFNNMVQLQPTQNTSEAMDNRPTEPEAFNLDAVTPDDQARLIRFYGVQFANIDTDEVFETGANYTIYHDSNEFVVRTGFWEADYIGEPVPHGMVDIAGVILQHQEVLQLVPRFASDIEESDIHPYTVTFHVDLGLAIEHDILEGFDPEEHHVMITGEMFDWTEPFPSHEDMLLEQIGSDPVTCAITLSLPAGVYAYKYFSDLIGSGWGGGEWDGGNNRMVEVTGEMDVYDHFGFTDDNMPVNDTGPVSLTISPNPAQRTINGKDDDSANEISLMDIPGQVISLIYNTSELVVDEEYYVYVYHENSEMEISGEFFTISDVLYELSLSVAPPETGDVNGSGLYAEGEEVVVTASPQAGYQFSHWSGDIEYMDNPNAAVATVVMPSQEISLTANFQIITHVVINASAGEGGSIDPEGAVTVDYGTDQSFTITADTGYLPYELFVDGIDVGPHDIYPFVHAEQDHTIHATFTLKTYTLSYTAEENGTLSGETTQVVQHGHDGSPVEAIPDEGYRFTQWSDGVAGNPRTDTGVTDDLNVTAHFSINIYTITAVPNDEDFGSVTGAGDYEHFENVILTATPETGYHFVEWQENGDVVMDGEEPAGATYTFMAEADRDLIAHFAINTYTLLYNAGENGSLVGETLQLVDHGSDGNPVEAIPDEGYHFTQWSDGLEDNPRTDTDVTADLEVEAQFAIITYEITSSSNDGGMIDPEGSIVVAHGEDKTFAVIPEDADGYEIHDVLIDGESQGVITSHTFESVTQNHTIEAIFALKTYVITASAGEGGSIDPEGDVVVDHGDSQLFTITPDEGYEILDVLVDGDSVGAVAEYEFTGVTHSHTITAEFYVDETGLETLAEQVTVYPNPFNNTLTITNASGLRNITLKNLFGQTVFEKEMVSADEEVINTESLPPGVYFLRMIGADNSYRVLKIMKK